MACRNISALSFLPPTKVKFLEMFRALVSSDQPESKARIAETGLEITLVPIEKPILCTAGAVEERFDGRTRSATPSSEAQIRKLKDSAVMGGDPEHSADIEDEGHQPINPNKEPRTVYACLCSVEHDVSIPCAKRRKSPFKLNHLGRITRNFFKKLTSTKRVDGSKKRKPNEINVTTEISVTSEPRTNPSRPNTVASDYGSPLTVASTMQTAHSTLNSTISQSQTSEATSTETEKNISSRLSHPNKISFTFPNDFQPSPPSNSRRSEDSLVLYLEEHWPSDLEKVPSKVSHTTSGTQSTSGKHRRHCSENKITLDDRVGSMGRGEGHEKRMRASSLHSVVSSSADKRGLDVLLPFLK